MTEPIIAATAEVVEDTPPADLAVAEETALAGPAPAGDIFSVDPEKFQAALDIRRTNRNAMIKWVKEALVDGVDFGSIMIGGRPSKPSLWKPGAEKIGGMLGLVPRFPGAKEYEEKALRGEKIETILLRCELVNGSGQVVGEGMGARSVAKENGDLNKALKMASKSAQIDATLRCGGLSEVFTQDIEDMNLGTPIGGDKGGRSGSGARSATTASDDAAPPSPLADRLAKYFPDGTHPDVIERVVGYSPKDKIHWDRPLLSGKGNAVPIALPFFACEECAGTSWWANTLNVTKGKNPGPKLVWKCAGKNCDDGKGYPFTQWERTPVEEAWKAWRGVEVTPAGSGRPPEVITLVGIFKRWAEAEGMKGEDIKTRISDYLEAAMGAGVRSFKDLSTEEIAEKIAWIKEKGEEATQELLLDVLKELDGEIPF